MLGELLLRGTTAWYIKHVDGTIAEAYKYIPAFWNDSAGAVLIEAREIPDPSPLTITVNDDGDLHSIEIDAYGLQDCVPKLQHVFDAVRKTLIFAWFDPFTTTKDIVTVTHVKPATQFRVHQTVNAVFNKKNYEGCQIVDVSYAATPSRKDYVDVWFRNFDDSLCTYDRSNFKYLKDATVSAVPGAGVRTTRSAAASALNRKDFPFQKNDIVETPWEVETQTTAHRKTVTTEWYRGQVLECTPQGVEQTNPGDRIEIQFDEDGAKKKFLRDKWTDIKLISN